MKKTLASIVFAAVALVSTPAFAQQASGTVVVNGTVAAKCTASALSGTIALGELAKSDGTVDKTFTNATGGLSRSFTVRCNSANPQISVEARSLVNAAATNSPAGYTNTVNYTAKLAALAATGTSTSVSDLSSSTGATAGLVGGRLSTQANNVTLTLSDGITADSTAILEAGTYTGSVDIIIAPAA